GASGDASLTEGVAPIVARGESAIAAGDLSAGVDAYREAYERTPWNTRIQNSLVAAYAARAEKERTKPGGTKGLALAEQDLRAALEISPKNPELERNLAVVLLDQAGLSPDDAEAARLRAEANALAPDLVAETPALRLGVERRLDIAYDLLQRGQLDAGIDQLQALVRDDPESVPATRLLAQALVRKGGVQTQRHDYPGARQSFTNAVELYARLLPCDGTRCDKAELELAHRNRVDGLLDAEQYEDARAALAEARGLGIDLSDLEKKWPELKAP
ncbi:MAG: tetratricopeptide repeat protein, partial [Solirubrobacteraceae bacterium]